MDIQQLTLKHFKGITDLELTLDGRNAWIYGANATGKTTIYDAFLWLLFGKDSQGKTAFAVKTLDADGNTDSGLEHSVEGMFAMADGSTLTLTKTLREKWTKKRGQTKREFTGHETSYSVDGVPSKQKEFDARVQDIMDEETFRLLTSPTYFPEQLHWQDRRRILLDMCGDITDEDVIKAHPKLADLQEILGKHTAEEAKKIIRDKMRRTNSELEQIPIRIDEASNMLVEVDTDAESVQDAIKEAEAKVAELQEALQSVSNAAAKSDIKRQMNELSADMAEKKSAYENRTNEQLESRKVKLHEYETQLRELGRKQEALLSEAGYCQGQADEYKKKVQELRDTWAEAKASKDVDVETDCPACGQSLPADAVDAAVAKAMEQQAQHLQAIMDRGKECAAKQKEFEAKAKQANAELSKVVGDIESAQQSLKLAQSGLEKDKLRIDTFSSTEDWAVYVKRRDELQAQLDSESTDDARKLELQADIEEAKEQLETHVRKRRCLESNAQADLRIQQLKAQEKSLAQTYETLQRELFLVEEFVKSKVRMLTDSINGEFELARFQLFRENINGGIEEVCEVLVDGVPYSAGLNNAAKIQVGLDIIRRLAEQYDAKAPIFVDNRESVTEIPVMCCQVISLVVSPNDAELRLELEEEDASEWQIPNSTS